ncbi:unnamed protein product, partial [Bubo scandiacus]
PARRGDLPPAGAVARRSRVTAPCQGGDICPKTRGEGQPWKRARCDRPRLPPRRSPIPRPR